MSSQTTNRVSTPLRRDQATSGLNRSGTNQRTGIFWRVLELLTPRWGIWAAKAQNSPPKNQQRRAVPGPSNPCGNGQRRLPIWGPCSGRRRQTAPKDEGTTPATHETAAGRALPAVPHTELTIRAASPGAGLGLSAEQPVQVRFTEPYLRSGGGWGHVVPRRHE